MQHQQHRTSSAARKRNIISTAQRNPIFVVVIVKVPSVDNSQQL
jgi:hypothetical protein